MALSFKKPFSIATFIFFFLLLSLPHFIASASPNDLSCLKVSPISFTNSAKEVITNLQQVTSILSRFTGAFGQSHLLNAVSDCLDLLDMSADQLDWIISATENPRGKDNGTGNLSSDLRTWLSAVLVNQDTCIEGLQGTNVMGLVSTDLYGVMSLVMSLLDKVIPNDQHTTSTSSDQYPLWMKDEDMKLLQANETTADAVVAADGSGNYSNVTDAVKAAPELNMKRYVIYVKKGVYVENVGIDKKKWNIMMIGEGMNTTFISGNRSCVDGWKTFGSATFAVKGRGFIARDISFINTAGPEKHQAVALRSDSDLSVFYRCGIFGYQDSLYPHSMRQFYRECTITGTVDFIFGDATAVFQNCQIIAKQGKPDQKNTVTAQGRQDPGQPTGFSFQFCNISAENETIPTYLGRPWKNFSRTIFMQSHMSNAIRPEGWLEWNETFAFDTLYYGEYNNSGPGAELANRVKWPGYHVFNDSSDANKYTVAQFIEGNLWLPSTGVNYTAGL
ncbi:pectinesterase/pectinesterase inhibitor PPE8B-like [Vicia villosa]|uniref:pectinesterase/pectinesterase inhibitor PPE8B-like n=1 Tax=Vicia villosa TaxID=3911 RepID=UPI00273B7B92|nr:pectinesterase/pectinesterase inhibitor PPE8B-like [Vicia villosa]